MKLSVDLRPQERRSVGPPLIAVVVGVALVWLTPFSGVDEGWSDPVFWLQASGAILLGWGVIQGARRWASALFEGR